MSRSEKIAIVDDEPINIKVVQKHLRSAGHDSFVTTTDSERAVDLLQRESPDVVLLDIMMPEVDGLQVLEQLRSSPETDRIPVLILTSVTDPATKQRALELGATDFLPKPVDPNDLVPRVRNALLVKSYQDKLKDHARELEQQVRERTAELERTRVEVIHCLARAAEFRDNETGRHVLRVGHYVGIIARELGLDDPTVDLMQHASLLHDVGKIGIPDSILLKPDKLTPEEFELMQTHTSRGKKVFERLSNQEWNTFRGHPSMGAEILEGCRSDLMRMAERIALSHHERWDGTGYPLALAGENIPIEGRVTSVADVFDALSSRRPYKPAFPLDKCLSIMRRERGRHFDPHVLDAFLARIKEIVEIQIEYADIH